MYLRRHHLYVLLSGLLCTLFLCSPSAPVNYTVILGSEIHGGACGEGIYNIKGDDNLKVAVCYTEANYIFKSWVIVSGINNCIIDNKYDDTTFVSRITGPVEIKATFSLDTHSVTINQPVAGGTLFLTPSSGGNRYYYGQQLQLIATPATGYLFSQWTGDISGTTNPCTLTVSNNTSVGASFTEIPGTPGVIYVRSNATGLNNGTNWVNAYTQLEIALSHATSGSQIWVAKGTYSLSNSPTDVGYTPPSGTLIYGGFNGFERQLNQRMWYQNFTFLTGNDSHDYIFDLISSNNVTINGFVLQKSVINCIYIAGSNNVIENCIIRDNNSRNSYGGANAIAIVGASNIVRNCVFLNNRGTNKDGHAIYINQSNTRIENCIFTNNSGPALSSAGGTVNAPNRILNCTVVNNEQSRFAFLPGGITCSNGALDVQGCILYGNKSLNNRANQLDSASRISYSCIQDCNLDSIGVLKRGTGWLNGTNFETDPLFNRVSTTNDADWFSPIDQNVPLIPTNRNTPPNTSFFDFAIYSVRAISDLRGSIRPLSRAFDLGAYETPFSNVP
jgi:hypothetical protein